MVTKKPLGLLGKITLKPGKLTLFALTGARPPTPFAPLVPVAAASRVPLLVPLPVVPLTEVLLGEPSLLKEKPPRFRVVAKIPAPMLLILPVFVCTSA